jgi:hypothetical protein
VAVVTGSCAEIFHLTLPEDVELDTDVAVTSDQVVAAFRQTVRPMDEAEHVDLDVDDNLF